MLMSDSHYCRAVITSTSKILPSPIRVATHSKQGAHTVGVGLSIILSTRGLRWIEVENSMRRSRRDDSAGKEVGIKHKARWRESDVAHVPERGSSGATPCFSRLLRSAATTVEHILSPGPIRGNSPKITSETTKTHRNSPYLSKAHRN
ncbi:hypothetical protein PoB_006281200 [Plakobranchus ocellatus]|uniref:Uncharacterized protein n=1 Tax=Plakobranchus ocellatus TaxID=259542 RepID=A0AAV4CWL9_9GAST|nr:hypothetical protein PoB_006281200 [Plakobranchus ocellatus]